MEIIYVLEVDYEWCEVSTNTKTHKPADKEAALVLIEQVKTHGKYEGYRLYKITKELIGSA